LQNLLNKEFSEDDEVPDLDNEKVDFETIETRTSTNNSVMYKDLNIIKIESNKKKKKI